MWSVLQSPLGMELTFVLLHFVWQATVLYCAWRLISTLPQFRLPQSRYCGALATLLLILMCPAITFGLLDTRDLPTGSRPELLVEASTPQISLETETTSNGAFASKDTTSAQDLLNTAHNNSSYSLANVAYLVVLIQPYLMLFWTTGVIVLGLRICISYLGTVWLRRVGLGSIDSDLLVRYANLATRLNLLHLPPVAFSHRISQALTVGLLRPMVLLPAAWMTEISPEVLEAVLSHELAHIRRQDLWINFLQRVAETIFFYHPVVWWISTEIRREREVCCDDLAIEALGQRLGYAKSLEQVASWQHDHSNGMLAAHFLGEHQGQLIGRVRQILGISTPQAGERSWPAGLILVFIPLMLWVTSAILWPETVSQASAEGTAVATSDVVEEVLPSLHSRRAHQHQALPANDAAHQDRGEELSNQSVVEVLHELREEVRQLRDQVRELKDHHDRRPPPPPRHHPPHDRRHRPHPGSEFDR
ncbi:M56 family metallopeptidase [Bremerella alba]|uniref:Peptidase M56 domain-containing protein n=1 Tax=Bremerella alba TaxID=980252 RepID=A0A7V9A754_9BACT|nr:M56 family metallopeptidase [Bremerella alba]MBA2114621.1 hypothetical protein [Bremerella alba]